MGTTWAPGMVAAALALAAPPMATSQEIRLTPIYSSGPDCYRAEIPQRDDGVSDATAIAKIVVLRCAETLKHLMTAGASAQNASSSAVIQMALELSIPAETEVATWMVRLHRHDLAAGRAP